MNNIPQRCAVFSANSPEVQEARTKNCTVNFPSSKSKKYLVLASGQLVRTDKVRRRNRNRNPHALKLS